MKRPRWTLKAVFILLTVTGLCTAIAINLRPPDLVLYELEVNVTLTRERIDSLKQLAMRHEEILEINGLPGDKYILMAVSENNTRAAKAILEQWGNSNGIAFVP